ncbi:MAG: hypothetical protein Q9218_004447 [Villophora microphyllina]
MCCSTDILLALLAIIFPPIAVWIKSGICTADSLINILLCTLGFIPGLLHAWYIIAKYPDESSYEYTDLENGQGQQGHVTYYYVNDSRNNSVSGPAAPQRQGYPSQRGYGTVQNMGVPAEGQQAQPSQQPQRQGQQGPSGEGSSQQAQGVPPSYEQAIAGDNKVQT